MKNFKRIFALVCLLILAAACLTLASCGGSGDDDDIDITVYMTEDSSPEYWWLYVGDTINLSEVPTRPHYTFLGLYDEQGGQIVDANGYGTVALNEDVTLYARWQPATYTVKFDANGGAYASGSSDADISALYGSQFSAHLPTVDILGYDFIGWFSGEVQVSNGSTFVDGAETLNSGYYNIVDGTVQLVARFEIKQLDVTFEYNDGINQQKVIKVPYGETIPAEEIPELDMGNKMIVGWSQVPGSTIAFEGEITQNVTLFPIWKNYKDIEFYTSADAEEPEETLRVFEGEAQPPYTPEKPGYEFDGWFTSTLFSGNPEPSIHYSLPTTKLYAKWNLAYYEIEYVTNNGTTVGSPSYTIDSELELPVLTKENFTFLGWCVEEDLSDTPRTKIVKGTYGITKLYGKFKGDDKTVVFNAGEGSVSPSQMTVEYYANYTLPVPKYDGYEFQGWFTGEGDDAAQLTDKEGASLGAWEFLEESTTVYAKYKQKFYVNVSTNIDAAGSFEVNDYYVKDDIVKLTATVNDGYEIVGWFENDVLITTKANYEFTMSDEDVNLEIRYKAQEFTITLDVGDGICKYTSATVSYGEKYELPIAYKQGYLFIGWQYEGEYITDGDGVSINPWKFIVDSANLVAVYEENESGAVMIVDLQGFLAIADNPGGYYVLIADIDLSGVNWVPFEFSGTLLGNGCVIKNLSLESSSGNLGMFTKVTGTIKDIKLQNLSVKSTSYSSVYVGGLCAELAGGNISGIEVRGTVTGDYCYIGGIVGRMTSGSLKNCKSYATVSSETYENAVSAGGVVSIVDDGEVANCKNYGAVSIGYNCGGVIGICYTRYISELENYGNVSGKNNIGGVIGIFDEPGTYTINNLKNTGAVTGEECVGGVVGRFLNVATWNYNDDTYKPKYSKFVNEGVVEGKKYSGGVIGYFDADIYGSYSDGSVIVTINGFENKADVTGTQFVGGLFGYAYSDNGSSQIANVKSSGAITAESYVGGLAGRLANIRLVDSSNAGTTISATYYSLEGSTYYAYVGGYVGYGYYIENCHNAIEITYTEGGMYVGGIAGRLDNTIKDCTNTANISAEKSSYVGGLVGELSCTGTYDVVKLTNSGAVTGVDYVGGVFGALTNNATWSYNDSTYNLKLSKIVNSGAVVGASQVGGCIGRIYVNVSGSYSDGSTKIIANALENTANVKGTRYVGGLIGYAYSDNGSSQISSSKSVAAIEAESYIGGLAGQLENVRLVDSSNAGSTVSATGYYLEGSTYYAYVGGYVGYGYYIENCHNAVEITYTEGGMYVGGIAGRLLNPIKNCSNTANITAAKASYVGGLVGELTCTGSYDLTELTNSGAITGVEYVGGIFGALTNNATWSYNDSTYNLKINKMTNSGAVVGTNQVGGCIGRIYLNVSGSYSDGSTALMANGLENTASVTGTSYVGGLIGYAYSDNGSSQITASKSSGAITAEYYVGGLAGRLENVRLVSSSNEGASVNATSYLVDGTNYYAYVGGYVGYGYYIENCHNAVEISYSERGIYVGGIAGRILNVIKNASNTANVTAANSSYVGGLVGELYCAASYELTELTNSGAVTGKDYTGGVFGTVINDATWSYNDDTYNLKINKVVNSGAVVGADQVGGCIGRIYVNISGSYSDGSTIITANNLENTASVTGTSYVGGLIGYAYSDNGSSQISGSKSSGAITAEYYVGGLAGYLGNVKLVESSNEGASVTATSCLIDGTSYYAYLGGYVGYGYYIENCNNAVSISYSGLGMFVGGIAGQLSNPIKNCSNTAEIYAPNASYVGGLVGEAYCLGTYEFSGLTNSGAVTGKEWVGGLIGRIYNCNNGASYNDTHYTMKLTKFNNTGAVVGKSYVGGCVGYIYTDVYGYSSEGSVVVIGNGIKNGGDVTGETNVGGIVGVVSTDNAGSIFTDYECTGLVNGIDLSTVAAETLQTLLVCVKTNFALS